MKVVLFAESLINRAGIERMTVNLAHLLSCHYEVNIILIETYSSVETPYQLNENIRVISLHSKFSKLNYYNIKALRAVLKDIRPNVLITVATPLVRISAPAIIGLGIRNIGWEHFNLYSGSKLGSIWKIISTYLVNRTVVLTDADILNFKKCCAHNVVVIPNFSIIDKNVPSSCSSKTILAVGRHSVEKGFDLLIRAWAKTRTNGWKLKIIGDGHLKDSNIALAKELGVNNSIIFASSTPDIVSEYQSAGCFVLSSRHEGLVMVLIEARMMGLPCVSFDCPNSPREIIRDNIDGFLVPPEDVDALAQTLSSVLSMENLKHYGMLAKQDATNRYGASIAMDKWSTIING